MARKPKGYKKCLDLLACGNELIAIKGKPGRRDYVEASAIKSGNKFILTIGDSRLTTQDESEFMKDLREFADFTSWLAIEPEPLPVVTERQVQLITLDLEKDSKKKMGRRR